MDLALTSRSRLAALASALVLASCVAAVKRGQPFDPKTAATGALERLAVQKSFAFELSYHTDFPFPMAVSFTGVRESTDREQWSGSWRRRGDVSRVDLRGDGPDQFERAGSGWRKAMRGAETRILDHARGAFGSGVPEYVETRAGRYVYRFRPELPTLDPTQTKRLVGRLEIDRYSGLPLRVYGADSAKTAEWELKLARFNSTRPVDVPFVSAMTVLARPARGTGKVKLNQSITVLKQRLEELGWEYRLNRTGASLEILLGRVRPLGHAVLLLDSGRVEVWICHPPSEAAESSRALPVGGDAARLVVLDRQVGANGTVGARLDTGSPVEAGIEVTMGVGAIAGLCALVLDGRVLSTAARSEQGRVVFFDVGNEEEARLIVALANHGVLTAHLEVTGRP